MEGKGHRVTVEQVEHLEDELARQWARHDLDGMTSAAVKYMTAGSATDWGMRARVESPVEPITLGGGIPDPNELPRTELAEAMQRVLAVEDDSPLRYGGSAGYEPLRAALAGHYRRVRGIDFSTPDHFLMTNGGAGAIDAICRTFLSPGDIVITEAPTFSGTLRTFRGYQAEVLSVGVDEDGMKTDELRTVLEGVRAQGKRVKLIYTISNFHNPMGVALSLERRHELLRLAAEHGAFILDDDAYGEIYFTDDPPLSLAGLSGGHGVIMAGTFSKMIATGLRIGWVHADPEIIDRITRMRFDMGNSPLLLHTLADYMSGGRLEHHVRKMRELYSMKARVLEDALVEYCEPYLSFQRPQGGYFLWVELHEGLTADEVQRAALEEGVAFPIGYAFFPDRADPTGEHIRLAYTWTSPDDLREAARRLARACERVASAKGAR